MVLKEYNAILLSKDEVERAEEENRLLARINREVSLYVAFLESIMG
jgi:hypothetical protein